MAKGNIPPLYQLAKAFSRCPASGQNENHQIQILLLDSISNLPPGKRKFAEGVIGSFSEVLEAADGSESEMKAAARDFRKRIAEAEILSYDIVSSPFPLTRQQAVLLCEGAFSVAYELDNSNGSQRFLINGRIYSGVPGKVFTLSEGGHQLRLRYMEYLEGESTAILSFDCQ